MKMRSFWQFACPLWFVALPLLAVDVPGSTDATFSPPALGASFYEVHPLADGGMIASGPFAASATNHTPAGLVKLTSTGAIDPAWPTTGGVTGGDARVVVEQHDGKILIAGKFTTVHGVARNGIARLNADGTLDTSFDTPGPTRGSSVTLINWVTLLPDGKVLVGGDFSTWAGVARNGLVRLLENGTLDTDFHDLIDSVTFFSSNDRVYSMALQPVATAPGYAIIATGGFYGKGAPASAARSGVIRLNADGSKDSSFAITTGSYAGATNQLTYALKGVVQLDGKIVVSGPFVGFNGQSINGVARLNADGSLDTAFRTQIGTGFSPGPGAFGRYISDLLMQPDGKILVGGIFNSVNGVAQSMLARLNADGSFDSTFRPDTARATASLSMELQRDGKVLLGMFQPTVATQGIRRYNNDLAGPTGSINWASATASVTEGDTLTLTLNRTGGSSGAVSVNYLAVSGTARSGYDFPETFGKVSWADGDAAPKTITISPPLDFQVESNETFDVKLGVPLGGVTLGAQWSTTVTLINGDLENGKSRAFFGTASSTATEGAGTVVHVPVSLSIPPAVGSTIEVPFTVSGTAKRTIGAGLDVTITQTSVIFAEGETSKDITLTLFDDAIVEKPETVVITLGQPTAPNLLDADHAVHTVTIIDDDVAPTITTPPAHVLATLGTTAPFSVVATGSAPLRYSWLRNNAPQANTNSPIVSLSNVQLSNAATLAVKVTNAYGSATSATAELTVVDNRDQTVIFAKDSTAALTVPTAGKGLSYQWQLGGSDVAGSPGATGTTRILGTKTNKLVIKLADPSDSAVYVCRVTDLAGSHLDVNVRLKVFDNQPVITATPTLELGDRVISEYLSVPIPVNMADHLVPTSFSATGLPSGLKLDTKTGIISGRPLVVTPAKGFAITVSAKNAKGTATVPAHLTVTALPAGLAGTWLGSVNPPTPPATLNSSGGRLDLNVSAVGVVSGTVTLGGTVLRFSGNALDTSLATLAAPTAEIVLPRAGASALTLKLTLNATSSLISSDTLTGTLKDSTDTVNVEGWRKVWTSSVKPNHYDGYYTLGMENDASVPDNESAPQGIGYAYCTVTATTGDFTMLGMYADGTKVSFSGFVGPTGKLLFFQPLYANAGAFHSLLTITPGTGPTYDDNLLAGVALWNKPTTTTDRAYKAGFTNLPVSVIGGRYVAPTPPTTTVVLGFQNQPNNARVKFSTGGLPLAAPTPSPDLTLQIKPGGGVVYPSATSNPRGVSLSLSASTGIFSGKFTANDPNPLTTNKIENRSASCYGAIVPQAGGPKAVGFFLLQKLSAPPTTTTNSSAKLSGLVEIVAGP